MPAPNLAAALLAALAGKRPSPVAAVAPAPAPVPVPVPAAADILLNALRNSATGRDQIMQRRIGVSPDDSP